MTKSGQLRKTNFSGGAPRTEFNEISNNDGTISYKVSKGKFKDYFVNLEGDRVGLDRTEAASFKYDPDSLELIYQNNNSDLNNAQLYVNRNTGYFYFGFDDLDKYLVEKKDGKIQKESKNCILTQVDGLKVLLKDMRKFLYEKNLKFWNIHQD